MYRQKYSAFIILSFLLLLLSSPAGATGRKEKKSKGAPPADSSQILVYTDEFLDTVSVKKKSTINDYTLIGFQYGVGIDKATFNPVKSPGRSNLILPGVYGVTLTKYGKLFGYMPYFGIQVGAFYGQDGVKFEPDKDGRQQSIDGATKTVYDYIEFPAMAHFHVDIYPVKIMINAGMYGGYRLSIHREGEDVDPEYTDKFYDYEKRFDYGVKAGGGIAFMLDPIELHFTAMVRYGLSSYYEPDYKSRYYYRYAYPFDIILSAGIHFQLTKRTGMTSSQLKSKAREAVYPVEPIVPKASEKPSSEIQTNDETKGAENENIDSSRR